MSNNPFTEQRPTPQHAHDTTVKTLLIVLGVVGVMGLLLCGGVALVGYYAYQQIQEDLSFDDYESDDYSIAVQDAVKDSPELLENIGSVATVAYEEDLTTTKQADGDVESYWYRATGEKGDVLLRAKFSEDEGKWFDSIEVVQDDNSRLPLTLANVPYDSVENRNIYLLVNRQPLIQESIGEVHSLILDWEKTDESIVSGPTVDENYSYWYSVKGDKGMGWVLVSENEQIQLLEFSYSDGRRVEFPGKPTSEW